MPPTAGWCRPGGGPGGGVGGLGGGLGGDLGINFAAGGPLGALGALAESESLMWSLSSSPSTRLGGPERRQGRSVSEPDESNERPSAYFLRAPTAAHGGARLGGSSSL